MEFDRFVETLFADVPQVRCELVDGRQVWSVHHAGQVRRVRGGRRSAVIYAEAVLAGAEKTPKS